MEPVTATGTDDELPGLASAPEMLVEGYRGAMVRGGLVKLNLFSTVLREHPRRIEQRAAVRLAIPVADFAGIVDALAALRDEIVAGDAEHTA